ncbi:hypothetical protein, partial [Bradyrhizobium sp.]|uniref:hypothetical protein n=1 Tax=Bradyrhizobium sp. TaxID=376 RepID=UPI0025C31258
SSLGRVAATPTPFPNFGKAEYFQPVVLTQRSRVLPAGNASFGRSPLVIPGRDEVANPESI